MVDERGSRDERWVWDNERLKRRCATLGRLAEWHFRALKHSATIGRPLRGDTPAASPKLRKQRKALDERELLVQVLDQLIVRRY